MNIETKNESCRCKELKEKTVTAAIDNERMVKIKRRRCLACFGINSSTSGDDGKYKEKFEMLIEINQGWKKDYEELDMCYEMLKGEQRLLEDKEKYSKSRIHELEECQRSLENELARLSAALYAQQISSNSGPSEEQCEILKSQMIVYKEDFEKERTDKENLREENEKYKNQLEDSKEIIKTLTRELDACQAREEARRTSWSEHGNLRERVTSLSNQQLQYVYPYHVVDQGWRREQQRRILHRNPPQTSHVTTWENSISPVL